MRAKVDEEYDWSPHSIFADTRINPLLVFDVRYRGSQDEDYTESRVAITFDVPSTVTGLIFAEGSMQLNSMATFTRSISVFSGLKPEEIQVRVDDTCHVDGVANEYGASLATVRFDRATMEATITVDLTNDEVLALQLEVGSTLDLRIFATYSNSEKASKQGEVDAQLRIDLQASVGANGGDSNV